MADSKVGYIARLNSACLQSSAKKWVSIETWQMLMQLFALTDFVKHSFQCAALSVWNSLPASVIGSDSLSVFKSRLKTFLFRKSYN